MEIPFKGVVGVVDDDDLLQGPAMAPEPRRSRFTHIASRLSTMHSPSHDTFGTEGGQAATRVEANRSA